VGFTHRFGSVRAAVADTRDGLQFEFRATGVNPEPGSDTSLVAEGYVTLTTLQGVSEVGVADRELPGVDPERLSRELHGTPATERDSARG
jgi:hypothetical protein